MTEYALTGPAGEIKAMASDIDPDVKTRDGWRWLPVETVDPPCDEAREVKEGPTVTIVGDGVMRVWTTRAKSEGEIEAERDALLDATVPPVVLALIADLGNRIAKLDGAPQLSEADLRAAARAAL